MLTLVRGPVRAALHTAVSLKPEVFTARLTALFCTGSISLNSSGTSALYDTAGTAGVVAVAVAAGYAVPAVAVAFGVPQLVAPGGQVTTSTPISPMGT